MDDLDGCRFLTRLDLIVEDMQLNQGCEKVVEEIYLKAALGISGFSLKVPGRVGTYHPKGHPKVPIDATARILRKLPNSSLRCDPNSAGGATQRG